VTLDPAEIVAVGGTLVAVKVSVAVAVGLPGAPVSVTTSVTSKVPSSSAVKVRLESVPVANGVDTPFLVRTTVHAYVAVVASVTFELNVTTDPSGPVNNGGGSIATANAGVSRLSISSRRSRRVELERRCEVRVKRLKGEKRMLAPLPRVVSRRRLDRRFLQRTDGSGDQNPSMPGELLWDGLTVMGSQCLSRCWSEES